MTINKLSSIVHVSEEVLRDNPPFTLERLIAAAERAELLRQQRWVDEIFFGIHLNPCIVLGEN